MIEENMHVRVKPHMKQISKTGCTAAEKLKEFDLFGTSISLNYPDGGGEHYSKIGACMSLLLGLTTIVFLV